MLLEDGGCGGELVDEKIGDLSLLRNKLRPASESQIESYRARVKLAKLTRSEGYSRL
jgi:hypothetical protein